MRVERDEKCSRYALAVRPVCTACKWVVMGVGWGEDSGLPVPALGALRSWAPPILAFCGSNIVAGLKRPSFLPPFSYHVVDVKEFTAIRRPRLDMCNANQERPHNITLLSITVVLPFYKCVACISSSGFR